MSDLITVSNGTQFYRIPESDLAQAKRSGFYRPLEIGRTIISDGRQILEIPLTDLESAIAEGYRNALSAEMPAAEMPAAAIPSQTSPRTEETTATQAEVSPYRQAELEREALHEQLQSSLAEASWYAKPFAAARLWWFRYRDNLLKQCRTNGLSIAIHVALLLLLSAVFLTDKTIDNPNIITVSQTDEPAIEEVIIETVEIEFTEPVEEVVEPESESMEVINEITEQLVSIDVAESFDGSMLTAPSASGSEGDGEAMEKPTKNKVQFFGAKTEAIDFVFVIDNSNSMTRGRFETALNELVKAVSKLNRRQRFYVIFYSDTAYPLFHPYSPKTLVPATDQNKKLLVRWLQTVPLCLRTDGKEALQLAFDLDPDVMFVLGDGAFTDGASRYFSDNPNKKVVVHTLGMEVNAQDAVSFKTLATSHRGTYQDVGVHPEAAMFAKQFPRQRNNKRNGYWGLKLPAVAKKKK
ncbi:vWA domain-containing protein [Stieleria varia]|uniref:von Willebrand factor type A domain protein n=1 Tax=Stieleria varia TaxID=2528005 RepID=A0A5C6ASN7_9BACT|nr:vWA domain-containing protein [Stieleria varia]TWU03005.1 von Willebrand factor type A domain protein [Stieleria varia]